MPDLWYARYIPVSSSVREVARQEHDLGRELLFAALLRSFGLEASERDISIGENGKPFLPGHPGICFNISHCDGLAVCALDSAPVGVDAEMPGYFADILLKKALSPAERAFFDRLTAGGASRPEWFFRFWTLKEAYVKRSGTGVDTDLTAFTFAFEGVPGTDAAVVCSDPEVVCHQVRLPSGHIVSLCCSGEGTGPSLRLHAYENRSGLPKSLTESPR